MMKGSIQMGIKSKAIIKDLVALHNSLPAVTDENVGFRHDLAKLIEKHRVNATWDLNTSEQSRGEDEYDETPEPVGTGQVSYTDLAIYMGGRESAYHIARNLLRRYRIYEIPWHEIPDGTIMGSFSVDPEQGKNN